MKKKINITPIIYIIMMVVVFAFAVACGAQQDKMVSPAKAKKIIEKSDTLIADTLISEKQKAEIDSIDEFHRYWYEVLDTNGDGDIDDIYHDTIN